MERPHYNTNRRTAINSENRYFTYTEAHREHCKTPRQEQFLDAILENKAIPDIALEFGISERNVLALGARIRKTAERYNLRVDAENPLENLEQKIPVKGISTHYSKDKATGEMVATAGWVKTDMKAEEMIQQAREIIKGMWENIPAAAPINYEPQAEITEIRNLMNMHVLTDYHLGMLAWAEECGTDWDTKKAEDFLMKFMSKAIAQAPAAKVGLLLQLGDFMHFDGILPVTPSSGHVLDADTRFAKVVRVAIRCLRRVIQMMLQKYPEVRVVMAEGNHDISSSVWMREMLHEFYIDEPRVTVDTNPNPFGALQHGKCMVAWHHGHKKRIKDLDKIIAGMYSEMFGATQFRYVHTGHMHHKEMMESNLMIAEMHNTISAPDAHSATGGYKSQRFAEVITYHEEFGEVARQRITPELIASL